VVPTPEEGSPQLDDRAALRLSVRNAAAFWAAVARTRGHELVQQPGLMAVVGDEHAGIRVLILDRSPDQGVQATIDELLPDHAELPVVVEDQFATLNLEHYGLVEKRLPVMVRDESAAPTAVHPSALIVDAVESTEQLRAAESIVVHGFDLPRMQPYQPGQAFPDDLLWYPGVRLFVAHHDGQPAGACLTVNEGTCAGIYWVTTLPAHRSEGVGRAIMQAALEHLAPLPASLTATAAGEPLYRSMGFRHVADAAWWSRPAEARLP
jgi:GNAT superfamily N-acetyltransferase